MGNVNDKDGEFGIDSADDEFVCDTIARDISFRKGSGGAILIPRNSFNFKDNSEGHRRPINRTGSGRKRPSFKNSARRDAKFSSFQTSLFKVREGDKFTMSDMEIQVNGRVAKLVPRESVVNEKSIAGLRPHMRREKRKTNRKIAKDSLKIPSAQQLRLSAVLEQPEEPTDDDSITETEVRKFFKNMPKDSLKITSAQLLRLSAVMEQVDESSEDHAYSSSSNSDSDSSPEIVKRKTARNRPKDSLKIASAQPLRLSSHIEPTSKSTQSPTSPAKELKTVIRASNTPKDSLKIASAQNLRLSSVMESDSQYDELEGELSGDDLYKSTPVSPRAASPSPQAVMFKPAYTGTKRWSNLSVSSPDSELNFYATMNNNNSGVRTPSPTHYDISRKSPINGTRTNLLSPASCEDTVTSITRLSVSED